MELDEHKKKNLEERMQFIHYYAEWVKKVPNEVWSAQQAKLINSFMKNARNFQLSPEAYLEMIDCAKQSKKSVHDPPKKEPEKNDLPER
jgi:hypothetical protein